MCQGALFEEVTFDQSPEGGEGGREPRLYRREEQFWVVGTAHAKVLR